MRFRPRDPQRCVHYVLNKMKIKFLSIFIGITSSLFLVLFLFAMFELTQIDGHFDLTIFFGNPIFWVFWLGPLSLVGLIVSSFGLYRMKKWGHLLCNLSLLLFFVVCLAPVFSRLFPNLFNRQVELGSGWIVFYHMNFSLETILGPFVILSLLFLLNIKSVRVQYY